MKPVLIVFLVFVSPFISDLCAQKAVPNVQVEDQNGQSINLASYLKDGSPKIVSIWATWCGPCRMELNALNKVYPEWKKQYNVEIVAITVDYPSMLARAKNMFEQNQWSFTFLHDREQELLSGLGIQGIPYSMLVDGKGKIQAVQLGYFPGYEKDLEQKIKAL